MGHLLSLRHAHSGSLAVNCEAVTRDPNEPAYNAETAGDYVVDRQAWASPNFYAHGQYVSQDCSTYTGNFSDCFDTPYNITINEMQNYMAHTH